MQNFAAGFLHPLTFADHLLALIAAGLLVGQCAGKSWLRFLVWLATGLAIGFIILESVPPIPYSWLSPLIGAALVSALVALSLPLSGPILAVTVLAVGTTIGANTVPLQHGLPVASETFLGATIASVLVCGVVAWMTSMLRRNWQRVGVRVVASWMFAATMLVLALTFARIGR